MLTKFHSVSVSLTLKKINKNIVIYRFRNVYSKHIIIKDHQGNYILNRNVPPLENFFTRILISVMCHAGMLFTLRMSRIHF